MWGMIGTWRMSKEGIEKAAPILSEGGFAGDAVEIAVKEVENFPFYKSVGFGGLPNEEMIVELDAAYMDGSNLNIGMVGALQDFANPISIARSLSDLKINNFLVAQGAAKYARSKGFKEKKMLSNRAIVHYKNRQKSLEKEEISPYSGHDTVGILAIDSSGHMAGGTSTSGLFMKKSGRIGDSPIIGSGLYVDSKVGGASATGLGEDLMKGLVSYEVVSLMKQGLSPQKAAEKVCFELDEELLERRGRAGDISLVCMNKNGEWGAASNIDTFSFSVVKKNQASQVYISKRDGNTMVHTLASQEWMDKYQKDRMAPLIKQ